MLIPSPRQFYTDYSQSLPRFSAKTRPTNRNSARKCSKKSQKNRTLPTPTPTQNRRPGRLLHCLSNASAAMGMGILTTMPTSIEHPSLSLRLLMFPLALGVLASPFSKMVQSSKHIGSKLLQELKQLRAIRRASHGKLTRLSSTKYNEAKSRAYQIANAYILRNMTKEFHASISIDKMVSFLRGAIGTMFLGIAAFKMPGLATLLIPVYIIKDALISGYKNEVVRFKAFGRIIRRMDH